jgi:hypothetical protein
MLSGYFLKTKQPRLLRFGLAKADYLLAISILFPLFAGACWATWSSFSCFVAWKTIPWLPLLPRIAVRNYSLPYRWKISLSVFLEGDSRRPNASTGQIQRHDVCCRSTEGVEGGMKTVL